MDCSTPGLPVHHQLLEFTQTHIHWVSDAIQPSHPLSPPSLLTFNLLQHQGLFKRVSSSHQVAKVLAFQIHHQSFQCTSWEKLGWMYHKLNQDCEERYQQLRICRWYHCNGRKWRGIKEPLDEVEREWKSWLKILLSNIIQFHHFMANRWWKSGSSDRFYFIGFKNHCRW